MSEFVQSTIVNASVEDCYAQWSQIHEFPKFMDHIESVTPTQEMGVWHWKAKTEMGAPMEWDAKWENNEPQRRITWHTVNDDDNTVKMEGSIGFAKLSDDETQVTTTFKYHLPGGIITESIAGFLTDPEGMVENDLKNFKQLMETMRKPTASV